MQIYNTLTGKKEEFKPLEKNKVKMYVCGPTVYNYIHIGNARPYIVFDAFRRYLEYKGMEVNYVQNFTDVDDKIIKKANETNKTMKEIADKYIAEAFKDADGLNVKRATYHPRVTEEIPSIIKMIQTLMDKGYAYEVKGSVYFDTQAYPEYGKLSKKRQEDLEAGARIAIDEEKRNPMDFVLWKPKKQGEPAWKSPWGEGRPGWHIECSVMAKKYLGDTIDIHAGGEDLVFPHHENEIAQSEAANGKPFANYWIHNRFLNVDNRKMSKSLGNFFTVRDVSKEFPYEVIRFFMLSAHYRSPINFSRELMESAKNGLERIKTSLSNMQHVIDHSLPKSLTVEEEKRVEEIPIFRKKFEKAMEDDINTADAIAAIFELVKFANTYVNLDSSTEFIQKLQKEIKNLCNILGLLEQEEEDKIENEIEDLIQQREEARKNKNWIIADQIRDQLKEQGIILEDTPAGVRWKRVNE
ncbi:MAG: cysteine--tRNA ligase [Epulopiscium sp.]|nr:cysteine--tRNA ligase [Candidatus Epulonipiscium sp.]